MKIARLLSTALVALGGVSMIVAAPAYAEGSILVRPDSWATAAQTVVPASSVATHATDACAGTFRSYGNLTFSTTNNGTVVYGVQATLDNGNTVYIPTDDLGYNASLGINYTGSGKKATIWAAMDGRTIDASQPVVVYTNNAGKSASFTGYTCY